MSAARLREAAALMRSRAWAARAGVWNATGDQITAAWSDGPRYVADCDSMGGPLNAQHIASWHPTVALAAADWLDREAVGIESGNWRPCVDAALAVATAYLGGDE